MENTPTIAPRTVSVATAAKALGIGVTSAWRLVCDGTVPSVKLGGRTLIEVAEIDRLIERHRRTRATAA